jgi:membrane protein implicated in regulation of membrane protease activity
MEWLLPLLVFVALLVGWALFLDAQSQGRVWTPLWTAFSTTLVAALFLISGSVGYAFGKSDRLVADTRWTGEVIWWQIGVGIGAALVAAMLWRKGIKQIRAESRR